MQTTRSIILLGRINKLTRILNLQMCDSDSLISERVRTIKLRQGVAKEYHSIIYPDGNVPKEIIG